jgi:hypothetical protein
MDPTFVIPISHLVSNLCWVPCGSRTHHKIWSEKKFNANALYGGEEDTGMKTGILGENSKTDNGIHALARVFSCFGCFCGIPYKPDKLRREEVQDHDIH